MKPLTSASKILGALVAICCFTSVTAAQIAVEFDESKRHHLSVLTGGTTIFESDETAYTLGVDYEYRVSELLGLGVVAEQAFGGIDSTTILAVADIHLWRGLALQIGPGIEVIDEGLENETNFVARFGALYEIEFEGGYTLSPQIHYDASTEDALVFGLALGVAF